MEDAEYPVYLKKQSYEDLSSISYTIDQVAQPKRYAMVLAELAERDKLDGGKARQNESKRSFKYRGILNISAATLSAIAGLVAICTGHVYGRSRHDIDITKDPVSFWINVAYYFIVVATVFYFEFVKDKK